MRRFVIVVVLFGALLAGACGRGGDNSSTDDSEFSGKGSSEFCDKARIINDDDSFNDQNATPEETRENARRVLEALNGLADDAPSEISEDVNLLLEALRPVFQAIADGKDLSTLTPEEQAQFERLQSPEFEAAGDRFNGYIEKVCGIDADEDGDTDGIDNSTDSTTGDTTGE